MPAEQIKGVLKHALQEVVVASGGNALTKADMQQLFGKTSPSGVADYDVATDAAPAVSNQPERGRIIFGDLVSEAVTVPSVQHRVQIDSETGASTLGMLMAVELVAPLGVSVCFAGALILFAEPARFGVILLALNSAATRISAVGAMKSAGFGEVEGLTFACVGNTALMVVPVVPAAERLRLLLHIDRPFLINSGLLAANVFAGSPVIPGGAIKGALARKLELCGMNPTTDTALSKLHFSHATPQNWPEREIPLSIIANGQMGAICVGDALGPVAPVIGARAGLFRGDWKAYHSDAVRAKTGIGEPPIFGRVSRAHVRITAESQAADEGALYFTEAVDPAGLPWQVTVDFGDVPVLERPRLFGALMAGLDGLGATGAHVTVQSDWADTVAEERPRPDGTIAITLETDGILAGYSDGIDAASSYAAYWMRVLGATMLDFCAAQALRGGYLGNRFRLSTAYQPFLVTTAGAIFLVQGADRDRLRRYLRFGLPSPVIDGKPTDWLTCPYQPENGWGRIRADWQGLAGAMS